jgi:hypothetical protein
MSCADEVGCTVEWPIEQKTARDATRSAARHIEHWCSSFEQKCSLLKRLNYVIRINSNMMLRHVKEAKIVIVSFSEVFRKRQFIAVRRATVLRLTWHTSGYSYSADDAWLHHWWMFFDTASTYIVDVASWKCV